MAKYNTVGDTGCTERQLKFIDLRTSTKMNITEICKEVGISRVTYYDWCKDECFNKEMNKRLARIHAEGLQYLTLKFSDAARKYWEIIEGKGTKTQAVMLIDYFDRFAGKAITPISVSEDSSFDLNKYLLEIKEEGEEKEFDS